MKTTFIWSYPHPLHKKWADSVATKSAPFLPKIFLNARSSTPLIGQSLSIIKSMMIPKSDVYLLEGMNCALPAIIRKRKNTKLILINSDTFFYDLEHAKGVKKKIYLWYLKRIDGIISTSEMMKKLVEKYTSAPNRVVYPGINPEFFKADADYTSKNIAHGLSLLRKQKGTDLVIEAFNKMKDKDKLYLIGDIGDVEIPHNKNIIATGWVDSPNKYLSRCSIYVNPARFEPFGMNIVEAMAAGLVPIVSENCGAKDIVRKISPKLIIKTNVTEILKTIDWLSRGNRKELLGKKAKKIARGCVVKNSIKNFKKAFYELIGEID